MIFASSLILLLAEPAKALALRRRNQGPHLSAFARLLVVRVDEKDCAYWRGYETAWSLSSRNLDHPWGALLTLLVPCVHIPVCTEKGWTRKCNEQNRVRVIPRCGYCRHGESGLLLVPGTIAFVHHRDLVLINALSI